MLMVNFERVLQQVPRTKGKTELKHANTNVQCHSENESLLELFSYVFLHIS
jgi:hypothetical protein